MNKEQVQQAVTENFNAYPEDYPIENGKATKEAMESVQSISESYWKIRPRQQPFESYSKQVYVEWVLEAFQSWVKKMNGNKFDSMTVSQLETAIKENARANFNMYYEDYPINSDGLVSHEVMEDVEILADNYWNNRADFEKIEVVTIQDYRQWCFQAFDTWVKERLTEQLD